MGIREMVNMYAIHIYMYENTLCRWSTLTCKIRSIQKKKYTFVMCRNHWSRRYQNKTYMQRHAIKLVCHRIQDAGQRQTAVWLLTGVAIIDKHLNANTVYVYLCWSKFQLRYSKRSTVNNWSTYDSFKKRSRKTMIFSWIFGFMHFLYYILL